MTSRTPRQLLRESLDDNARELALLPEWVRSAVDTRAVFSVESPRKTPDHDE